MEALWGGTKAECGEESVEECHQLIFKVIFMFN